MLARVRFMGTTTPISVPFLASVKFGKDAWDLAVEPVVPRNGREVGRAMPETILAFVQFISESAPHHELSVGGDLALHYGFKHIADVRVIHVAGSPVPAGRARTTKPIESGLDAVTYPAGTEVVLIEPLDQERSEWLVEVACGHSECRVPDETLVGGASYDVVEIALADLEPVP